MDRTAVPDAPEIWTYRSTNLKAPNPYWPWAMDDQDWTEASCDWKLQSKVNRLGFLPIHETQIQPGADQADFVPHVLGDERCLRVIENDAFLAIEPACGLVDFRHNRV